MEKRKKVREYYGEPRVPRTKEPPAEKKKKGLRNSEQGPKGGRARGKRKG